MAGKCTAAFVEFHTQRCICLPIGNWENFQFICPYASLVNWAVFSLDLCWQLHIMHTPTPSHRSLRLVRVISNMPLKKLAQGFKVKSNLNCPRWEPSSNLLHHRIVTYCCTYGSNSQNSDKLKQIIGHRKYWPRFMDKHWSRLILI